MVKRQAPANAGIADQVGRQKLQGADAFLTPISHAQPWVSLLLTAVEMAVQKKQSLR